LTLAIRWSHEAGEIARLWPHEPGGWQLAKNPGLLEQELADLRRGSWVVIDEVQRVPALLDVVHLLIESRRLRFALSGSSARKLRSGGSNLLAGRASVLHLYPFSVSELEKVPSLDRILRGGLLPMSVAQKDPTEYLSAYATTYLEQEIRAEALTRNLGGFARFLEVAARANGQVTNVSSLARDAQVARQTVQGYFDLLVDTLVGNWLLPWKLKRATKQIAHPKFFFFDTGVCRAMTGRAPYPLMPEETGALFETFLLHEVRAYLEYTKKRYEPHYWAAHDGVEVDLLVETAKGFVAVEMKSAPRWESRFGRGLARLREEMRLSRDQTLGVFTGPRSLLVDGVSVLTWQEFVSRLWDGDLLR
jgi:predicted AAA+ superfamily ATPase